MSILVDICDQINCDTRLDSQGDGQEWRLLGDSQRDRLAGCLGHEEGELDYYSKWHWKPYKVLSRKGA